MASQATTYTPKNSVEIPGPHILSSPGALQLLILITQKLSSSALSQRQQESKGEGMELGPNLFSRISYPEIAVLATMIVGVTNLAFP